MHVLVERAMLRGTPPAIAVFDAVTSAALVPLGETMVLVVAAASSHAFFCAVN